MEEWQGKKTFDLDVTVLKGNRQKVTLSSCYSFQKLKNVMYTAILSNMLSTHQFNRGSLDSPLN